MAEEEPSDRTKEERKERDCRKMAALLEVESPVLANALREPLHALNVNDRWTYLHIVSELVRSAPDGLWSEVSGRPARLYEMSEMAQVRLLRRALSRPKFCGVSTELISECYSYLLDVANITKELGRDKESEAHATLARKLLQIASLLYLESKKLRFMKTRRVGRSSHASVQRPCIRPPGESVRPMLRLVKK
jgi:hypothetical protein